LHRFTGVAWLNPAHNIPGPSRPTST
jgi:hypothetical protein